MAGSCKKQATARRKWRLSRPVSSARLEQPEALRRPACDGPAGDLKAHARKGLESGKPMSRTLEQLCRDLLIDLAAEAVARLRALQRGLTLSSGRIELVRLRTESAWLRAESAIIPFHPIREPDLDRLMLWCGDEVDVAVRLLHGLGGMGKTRLGIELVDRLRRQGWDAGFLLGEADDAPEQAFSDLLAGRQPLLVVVDSARPARRRSPDCSRPHTGTAVRGSASCSLPVRREVGGND